MLDYHTRSRGWARWLKKNRGTLAAVSQAIRDGGPLGSADFAHRRPPRAAAGWWNWKPTTHALDYLWMSGTTLVHSRRHFHKRFDLAERLMPDALALPPLAAADFQRWHLRQSLHAMGAATEMDLRMYLSFPRVGAAERRRWLARLLETRRGARDRCAGAGSSDPGTVVRPGRGSARPRGSGTTPDRLRGHHPPRPLRLLPVAPRAHPPPLRLPLHDRGLHAGATSAPTATTRCPSSTTASSSAASTRRSTAPSAASRSRACTSSPGSRAEPSPPPRRWGRLDRDAALAGLADTLRSLATFVAADPEAITLGSVAPASLRPPLKRRQS